MVDSPDPNKTRTAMLTESWLAIHERGFPLAVQINGKSHVLLFLDQKAATEGAAVLGQPATPVSCSSEAGNLVYQYARRIGNAFAIVDSGRVCPVKSAVHWEVAR